MEMSVTEIRNRLKDAGPEEFAALERSLKADARKGVQIALEARRKKLAAQQKEAERIAGLYQFDKIAARSGGLVVGLDEVGRGPVAGPVAVGAVVLPPSPQLQILNDSKQLSEAEREAAAVEIMATATAWNVQFVSAVTIDEIGIAQALRQAFSKALAAVEAALPTAAEVVHLDGNPLGLDPREINVVKGDSKSAAIAAASIVAKVTRDNYMVDLASRYPEYGFESHKGYGSAEHIAAIQKHGLCPEHRKTFCRSFMQATLF